MGLHGDGEAGDDSVSGFSLSPPPILRCPETSQDSNVADIELYFPDLQRAAST